MPGHESELGVNGDDDGEQEMIERLHAPRSPYLGDNGDGDLKLPSRKNFEIPYLHLNFLDDVILNDYVQMFRLERFGHRPRLITMFAALSSMWLSIETYAETMHYDIFGAINIVPPVLDNIRELRRGLIWIESLIYPRNTTTFSASLMRVLGEDYTYILAREQEHHASWLKRGGIGAFMAIARKWDRIVPIVEDFRGDIGHMLRAQPDRLDDIQSLRRYLAVTEAEWMRRRTTGG